MSPEHRTNRHDLSKVVFHLQRSWHGSSTETLWAERLDQLRFRLRNVPFYAFGVAAEDVVFAKPHGSIYEFERILLRGGHSTYRAIINGHARPEPFLEKWQQLERLGCSYEQGPDTLRAIDVAPSADIYAVYALLEAGEREDLWQFEEGYCGHPLKK